MKKTPASKSLVFIKELFYACAAVLFINSFVLASFEVPTRSMEDTVKAGDRLFVNRLIYGGTTPYTIPFTSIRIPHFRAPGFRSVERGDVIVFDWPGDRVRKTQTDVVSEAMHRIAGRHPPHRSAHRLRQRAKAPKSGTQQVSALISRACRLPESPDFSSQRTNSMKTTTARLSFLKKV